MSNPVSLSLHIGVHRTATTHFQRGLYINRNKLSEIGVRAYGPSYLRKKQDSQIEEIFKLDEPSVAPGAGIDSLRRLARGGDRVVLSEENFIGVFRTHRGKLKFPIYENAAKRVEQLARAIAPAPLDIALAVRNPVDWLASCYSQVLMGGTLVQPGYFFLDLSPMDVDWTEFVARLRSVRAVRRIVIWSYESYPGNLPRILAEVLNRQPPTPLDWPDEISHEGLSQTAVLAALADGTEGAGLRARALYPFSSDYSRFEPLPPHERAQVDEYYDNQLRSISAMEGVTFLDD